MFSSLFSRVQGAGLRLVHSARWGLSLRDGILLLSVVILPFFPFVAGLRPGHGGTFIEGSRFKLVVPSAWLSPSAAPGGCRGFSLRGILEHIGASLSSLFLPCIGRSWLRLATPRALGAFIEERTFSFECLHLFLFPLTRYRGEGLSLGNGDQRKLPSSFLFFSLWFRVGGTYRTRSYQVAW